MPESALQRQMLKDKLVEPSLPLLRQELSSPEVNAALNLQGATVHLDGQPLSFAAGTSALKNGILVVQAGCTAVS